MIGCNAGGTILLLLNASSGCAALDGEQQGAGLDRVYDVDAFLIMVCCRRGPLGVCVHVI